MLDLGLDAAIASMVSDLEMGQLYTVDRVNTANPFQNPIYTYAIADVYPLASFDVLTDAATRTMFGLANGTFIRGLISTMNITLPRQGIYAVVKTAMMTYRGVLKRIDPYPGSCVVYIQVTETPKEVLDVVQRMS